MSAIHATCPATGAVFDPGDVLWFEYHCNESHDSPDAPVWLRSHQQVTVLSLDDADSVLAELPTLTEREDEGRPLVYRVRFPDGLEWSAFEDELVIDRAEFCRPDPPERVS